MKAQVIISGVGFGGFVGAGVNIGVAAYLRIGERAALRNYAVVDLVSVGGASSTFVIGHVKTDYFFLGGEAYKKLMDTRYLAGKLLDIEVAGTVVGRGAVDIKIRTIDNDGVAETMVERLAIPARGVQATITKVRGRIRMIPAKLHRLQEVQ